MDESNVYSWWKHVCANNEEFIRICMQVKETDVWMEYLKEESVMIYSVTPQ